MVSGFTFPTPHSPAYGLVLGAAGGEGVGPVLGWGVEEALVEICGLWVAPLTLLSPLPPHTQNFWFIIKCPTLPL